MAKFFQLKRLSKLHFNLYTMFHIWPTIVNFYLNPTGFKERRRSLVCSRQVYKRNNVEDSCLINSSVNNEKG